MPSHRAAGVTIVTDDLQHAARHAAPTASAAGGGGGAPRVVQPKWIFDQICPSARADVAPEVRGSRPEGTAGSAETPPPGAGAPESAEESDGSDGFSEEY